MTAVRFADCRSSWPGFVEAGALLASDEGGESGGRPSECTALGLYSEAMTKWEYVTVPLLVHATKQILDNWGQDGWELVQVVPGLNPENLVAYLKRPIAASGDSA
jgi:hypothetical protein